MCLVLAAVVFIFAKETKGLTLEEIDYMYTHPEIKAWQSGAWGRRHIAETHRLGNDDMSATAQELELPPGQKKGDVGSGVSHVEDYAEKQGSGFFHSTVPTAVNSTNASAYSTPKISTDQDWHTKGN